MAIESALSMALRLTNTVLDDESILHILTELERYPEDKVVQALQNYVQREKYRFTLAGALECVRELLDKKQRAEEFTSVVDGIDPTTWSLKKRVFADVIHAIYEFYHLNYCNRYSVERYWIVLKDYSPSEIKRAANTFRLRQDKCEKPTAEQLEGLIA